MSNRRTHRLGWMAIVLVCCAACTSILGGFSVTSQSSTTAHAGDASSAPPDVSTGTTEDGGPAADDSASMDSDAALDSGADASACDASVCAASVSANGDHTCAILTTGSVVCWGDDTSGSGGPNGMTSAVPYPVTLPTTASIVHLGVAFTCALLTDQSVWCWGDNQYGTLGVEGGLQVDGGPVTSPTPIQVLPAASATDLAVGAYHACAKLVGGQVSCWGRNGFGQVGVARTPTVDPPTVVPVTDVNSVTAGSFETCFQRSSVPHGECMGENVYGELGLGVPSDGGPSTDSLMHPVPSAVAFDPSWGGVTMFAHAAGFHMGAVMQSGEVAMWGDNNDGQLGLGADSGTVQATPALVPGFGGVTQLSLMQYGSCALRIDQTVWCWGSTLYGQTGITANVGPVQSAPTQIAGLSGVTRIAAGFNHVCALLSGGSIECWGWNGSGQLGRPTTTLYDPVPAPVRF